jgi:hypothetical protein
MVCNCRHERAGQCSQQPAVFRPDYLRGLALHDQAAAAEMDKKLFQRLHAHALALERLLAEQSDLPLQEIIRDLRKAAEFILTATTR